MSHKLVGELGKARNQIEELQGQVATLQSELDYLKEIVHNTLIKNNPDYKRRFVLSEMGDFLNRKLANG